MVCHSRNIFVWRRTINPIARSQSTTFKFMETKLSFWMNWMCCCCCCYRWWIGLQKYTKRDCIFAGEEDIFRKINEIRTCNGKWLTSAGAQTSIERIRRMWVHCLHTLWVPSSKLHAMPHIKYDLWCHRILCSISFFNGSCFPSKSYHFIIQCRGPPWFKSELYLLNSFNVKRNRSTSFWQWIRFSCILFDFIVIDH